MPGSVHRILPAMSGPTRFDVDLITRAQKGEEAARNLVLIKLQPVLRAFFVTRVGQKSEVDDLIQNTLVRVLNSLPDLKAPDRFKGFAMKAALFELQDLYRGRYSAKELLYDPSEGPSGVQPAPAGDAVDVERALSSLSPKARRIIELREYGYRYEEIARMVDSTEAAIKMQVKRAFEKMRQALMSFWWLLVTV